MRDITVTARFRPVDVLLAGILLTRLPLPRLAAQDFERSARATWAYPLVGAVLGLMAALVWVLTAALGLPLHITAGLTLASMILMTGALHEDGLADTADGLWGGASIDRRLDIMKDSRIGTYGVLALILGVGFRWIALATAGPVALIVAATLSRAPLPAIMHAVPFAREDGLARSVGRPEKAAALAALIIGISVAFLCTGFLWAAALTLLMLGAATAMAHLATRKINGITGDILGATQQIIEILVLITLAT